MGKFIVFIFSALLISSCGMADPETKNMEPIDDKTVSEVIEKLIADNGTEHSERIKRGVGQVASLWRNGDGDVDEFKEFCQQNFINDSKELDLVFDRLANNFEFIYGYLNRISLELNRPVHEDIGPLHQIDRMFGSFSPGAHVADDLYRNRIAFYIALNFPAYSLDEKNSMGGEWDNRQWGYARLGDYFTSRVPPELLQEYSHASSQAGMYISEYNIFAGQLVDDNGETLFPEGMKLLAHWNIRDEIKSNYGQPSGQEKQEMLYNVMLRIINQDIPSR
jgi:hypothetical protein